uniref:ATP synthase F0 subunit 8 n=3 Tax=Aplysina TaxID=121476 RepID=H6QW29_APLCU|nr:ATP synthase F0 subunit 8 [Aplysina fulva]YP_005351093.1 ATP synthase F0 subunit 8 [Aplysina cauliformis]YP_010035857.1 ATP synthase F0 subunit 8 [Aplysina gerardogreeni]ABW76547.1 ATP synthase F0 subunit 8 [Aplysina fulva]ACA49804.1 ATP synthase F0 subunit 8 [Aplysina cauliformis]QQQ89093.1 ATP synthase F0 subunit 8 [Aplysina gerardogreeni]
MPQLDLTSFLTQYTWVLITLFILFSILVSSILPKIQQQLAVRSKPYSPSLNLVSWEEANAQFNIFKRLFLHKQDTQC